MKIRGGRNMDLDTLAFELWWRGFPVDFATARAFIVKSIESRLGGFGVTRSGSRDPQDVADEVVRELRSKKLRNALLRLILRRVGRDFEAFITGTYALVIFVLGGDPPWDDTGSGAADEDRPTPREAVEQLLGFQRAMTDAAPDGSRLIEEPVDVRAMLTELRDSGAVDLRDPSAPIRKATVETLGQARNDAAVFTEVFPIAVRATEIAYKQDFAGLGIFTILDRIANRYFRIVALLAMLTLRKGLGGEGIDQVNKTLQLLQKSFEAYLAVMDRFPQYKKYYRVDQEVQLSRASDEFVAKMRDEVAAFLDDNPDIKIALDVSTN